MMANTEGRKDSGTLETGTTVQLFSIYSMWPRSSGNIALPESRTKSVEPYDREIYSTAVHIVRDPHTL